MTVKTGKYPGDKLFHVIPCDNDTTTIHFMYVNHHKIEEPRSSTDYHVFSLNSYSSTPNDFITISGIEITTIGIRDKDKGIFTNPNEIHN